MYCIQSLVDVSIVRRWVTFTVFDTQDQIPKPASTAFYVIRVCSFIKPNFHHDSFLAHLQDHIKRIFFWVIKHLDQLNKVRMIELFHDRYFLLYQIQGIAILLVIVDIRGRVSVQG